MQLRYDDTLGTINDEGTIFGHERYLAHVDFLFFYILDGLVGGLFIINDQSHLYAQRTGVGNTAQLAFVDIKYRHAQFEIHVFQRSVATVADYREHRFECRMQPVTATLLQRYTLLGKLPVRIQLDCKQVWNIHHIWHGAKIFTDAFFLSVRVCHRYSPACFLSSFGTF